LKSLANAESSVSEVIKSRRALIDGLEKMLQTNRAELAKEETLSTEISAKKTQVDIKKHEVEDAIMRGISTEDSSVAHGERGGDESVARPEVEALTPPPVEAITPVGSPKPEQQQPEKQQIRLGPFTEDADEEETPDWANLEISPDAVSAGNGVSATLPVGHGNDFDLSADGQAKRRKISHGEEDYTEFAGGDLDADVAALLASQGK
jgi:regulator of Ty1 transposition protein 103